MRIFCFVFIAVSFLVSISTSITLASFTYDDYINQFINATVHLSPAEKNIYYRKLYNTITLLVIRNRSDAAKYSLYTSIQAYLKHQLSLSGTSSSVSLSSFTGMDISKVDLVKVRDAWLTLHNAERSAKHLLSFSYAPALEATATTRAHHLADIGKMTHARNSDDGYYSYASIKQRFIDQGIVFAAKEKSGQPLFTENLGRGYYSCKKTDCTDDFIKAITTSRTFFMSEKKKSYKPHYNAIIGNYQYIGLGVAITGGKYYLVTHYTQALK